MKMRHLLLRLAICLCIFGACLYSYLAIQNELTQLKVQIPDMEKELGWIREENRRLSYEVDKFQNPTHLMELAHRPEFGHLKHPLLKEILTVPEALATNETP